MSSKRTGYKSSAEKDFVRQCFDLPLISKFSADKGDKLAYFGMPGEECLDIRDWQTVLREVAAIERHKKNLPKIENRLRNHFKEIASNVYYGDVDDIILKGKGRKRIIGGKAAKTEVANYFDVSLDLRVWKFDIVNLDYFGRFFPRGSHDYPYARARRPPALRRLFEQERMDARGAWLLLLTVAGGAYPSEDMDHLTQYVENARNARDKSLSEAIDFVLSRDNGTGDPTVKLVHGAMSIFVASAANTAQLEIIPRGSVIYKGANNQSMVHCAFQFELAPNVLGSGGDILTPLKAPIIQPNIDGPTPSFSWATSLCPGSTTEFRSKCLEFLDKVYLPS